MALTGNKTWPLKAAANAKGKPFQIALLKDGFVIEGQAVTNALCVGTFACEFDNTGGSNGLEIEVNQGRNGRWEEFENSTAGDEITQADVGKDCYVAGLAKVAKTDGGGTRSKCGRIWGLVQRGASTVVLVGINPYA